MALPTFQCGEEGDNFRLHIDGQIGDLNALPADLAAGSGKMRSYQCSILAENGRTECRIQIGYYLGADQQSFHVNLPRRPVDPKVSIAKEDYADAPWHTLRLLSFLEQYKASVFFEGATLGAGHQNDNDHAVIYALDAGRRIDFK